MKIYTIALAAIIMLAGCVSRKKLDQAQADAAALRTDSAQLADKIAQLQKNVSDLTGQVNNLNSQNNQLGQQTADQQNQLSQSQQTLQAQQRKLQQLQALLDAQKAKEQDLKNKMTEALSGFSSTELTVTQKNGKVYVSLSEHLLFPSGSAVVNPKGIDALSKLAAVLNLNADVAVNIEGHTDSVPIRGKYQDNWDLSTARANSIVRILVNNYKVDPTRVEASGHSMYDPVDTNSTADGRAKNRRTEIILSPKLDEMYKLLETN
jgi:chemotaxis protein MotB